MEEQQYFSQGNMLVSSTRIELDGQTFAVRNVGSVKVTKPGRPWIAFIVALMAIGILIGDAKNYWGYLILIAAVAWIWQQLNTRRLVLVTGGGEVVAYKSTNSALVESLRAAIANAISVR